MRLPVDDKAGRLVVPKSLREQAGITAGEVEISLDGAAIRIESVAADELDEADGLLLLARQAGTRRGRGEECGLPTSAEHVLVDTSAALALVQRENPFTKPPDTDCCRVTADSPGMPRWNCRRFSPACHRRSASARPPRCASRPRTSRRPKNLCQAGDTRQSVREFAAVGLTGGAVYDGLVAAAAREHRLPLITCDRRAEPTYRALGITYELLRRRPAP